MKAKDSDIQEIWEVKHCRNASKALYQLFSRVIYIPFAAMFGFYFIAMFMDLPVRHDFLPFLWIAVVLMPLVIFDRPLHSFISKQSVIIRKDSFEILRRLGPFRWSETFQVHQYFAVRIDKFHLIRRYERETLTVNTLKILKRPKHSYQILQPHKHILYNIDPREAHEIALRLATLLPLNYSSDASDNNDTPGIFLRESMESKHVQYDH